MDEKVEKFANLIKETDGLRRLLPQLLQKYKSFGTVKGTFHFPNPTNAEQTAFQGLLKKDFAAVEQITITKAALLRALKDTPFAGIDLDEVVNFCFGKDIKTKKELQVEKAQKEDAFFENLIDKFKGTISGHWLSRLVSKDSKGRKYIHKYYLADPERLHTILEQVMNAGNNLPILTDEYIRISVFAFDMTKNPHAFDTGRLETNLLLQIIGDYLNQPTDSLSAQRQHRLFADAGIIKDDLLNNTCVRGITCFDHKGREHQGTRGYFDQRDPQILTLNLLLNTDKVHISGQQVYILENSGVFSTLCEQTANLDVTLICTAGQPTTASIILIEILNRQKIPIFYSGDFDPEGLKIADSLKQRYPNINLWRYDEVDYIKSISNISLSSTRLKKLDTIKDKKLKALAQVMTKEKRAGYQENLIGEYLGDIE